jgi:hypothetical protein
VSKAGRVCIISGLRDTKREMDSAWMEAEYRSRYWMTCFRRVSRQE